MTNSGVKRIADAGVILLVLLCIVGAQAGASAQGRPPSEYEVKAAFLYHFARFVDWPADAFATPRAPLIIGVVGEDPFGTILDRSVEGKVVRGRPLHVRRWTDPDSMGACHILYVGASVSDDLTGLLARMPQSHTLTVSDREDFTGRGGVIRFVMRERKVRFEVNQTAAEAAELKVSAKLLAVASVTNKKRVRTR